MCFDAPATVTSICPLVTYRGKLPSRMPPCLIEALDQGLDLSSMLVVLGGSFLARLPAPNRVLFGGTYACCSGTRASDRRWSPCSADAAREQSVREDRRFAERRFRAPDRRDPRSHGRERRRQVDTYEDRRRHLR